MTRQVSDWPESDWNQVLGHQLGRVYKELGFSVKAEHSGRRALMPH